MQKSSAIYKKSSSLLALIRSLRMNANNFRIANFENRVRVANDSEECLDDIKVKFDDFKMSEMIFQKAHHRMAKVIM